MIQGKLFESQNHLFEVAYFKKGKPTGKRHVLIYADTFEEVLEEHLLKNLCEKVHGHDWVYGLRDRNELDLLCHKESNVWAYYSVVFKNGNKVLCQYEVEIEVIDTRNEIINNPEGAPNRRVE